MKMPISTFIVAMLVLSGITACHDAGPTDAGTDLGVDSETEQDGDPGPDGDPGDPVLAGDPGNDSETDLEADQDTEIDDAEIVSFDLPATLSCGETYLASVTVRNNGNTIWTRDTGYKLGTVDEEDPFFPNGFRLPLPDGVVISPGQTHRFEGILTGPEDPASGVTDWQMVRESVHWFGGVASQHVELTCESCPVGWACFDVPGLVHRPTPADPVERLVFVPPAGTYHVLHLDLDVLRGPWGAEIEPGVNPIRHNIFWLVHDGANRDMFGYVNFEKPRTVHYVHGFDLTQVDKPKIRVLADSLPEGEIYHFQLVYDSRAGHIDMDVTRQGEFVAQIDTEPNIGSFSFNGSQTVVIDFGFTGENPAEPPTYDWEYRDLSIRIEP